MNCPACGHKNDDWDRVCTNCGQALPSQPEVPPAQVPEMPPAPDVPYAPPPAPMPPVAPAPYGTGGQYAPPPAPSVTYGQYAPPAARTGAPPMPETYLWQSIVATLLCCWPLGIPAIVYATRVTSLYTQGDYAGAQAASKSARTWTFIAVGVGVAVVLLYVLLVVVFGIAGFTEFNAVQ